MVQFLGLDYWQSVKEIANADEQFKIKAMGFTGSFTFKVTDKADLSPVYVKWESAVVTEVRYLNEGEKTDFTLEGPYETWQQVNTGELDGANAIMTRMLQFKGNMSAIIRYSKAFLRLFEVMQTVEVEY